MTTSNTNSVLSYRCKLLVGVCTIKLFTAVLNSVFLLVKNFVKGQEPTYRVDINKMLDLSRLLPCPQISDYGGIKLY